MTNIDIIKEYVNTGVRLPESQISKLTPELKATYFRKRIMVQDRQKNLAEYEWNLMNIKQKEFCIDKLGYEKFYNLIKNFSNKHKLKEDYKTIKGKDFVEYQWVDYFYEGFARVKLSEDSYNFIDKQGNLLSKEQNFKDVYSFKEGFAVVLLSDGTYNFLDKEGNFLSKQNFEWVNNFNNGFARVKLSEDSYNFIDKQGNLLSKEQNFKDVYSFEKGFAMVELSQDNWNYIDKQGNLLSKQQNFKDVYDFDGGFALVKLSNNSWYCIDKDLNFYDSQTKTPVPNPFNSINESIRGLVQDSINKKNIRIEKITLNELRSLVKEFLNESKNKREQVFLNGYEYWLDIENRVLYDKEDSTSGTSIYSHHLTNNEREQLLDYIKFGR
jgi:uncharacterized protein YaaR (DUF327 family)